jgi:hypothetical protein
VDDDEDDVDICEKTNQARITAHIHPIEIAVGSIQNSFVEELKKIKMRMIHGESSMIGIKRR